MSRCTSWISKSRETTIKLPTFLGSWRKQRSSRKTSSISSSLIMLKPLTEWITKFLKRWKYHTPYLYACQEATVRTRYGSNDWLKIRKGVWQGCILSPCFLNLYAEYNMWNPGLDESQAGIKIAGRNTNNHRYANNITLMAETKAELKSLLIRMKEESEKLAWNSIFKKLR